jgi:UDP-N-acetylglucosamine 3-dehydrogenase
VSVRLAVVGCGAAARRIHLPALRNAGAEVVAFASRTLASAEAAAAEWGGGGIVTDDWRKAVMSDDLEGVVLCTPNALHAEAAIAAAGAGKHVLVEKPIACTIAEADAMLDAAEQAGVVLVAAHNLRFAPPFIAMRDAVAPGAIGDVVGVRAAFGHGGPKNWAPEADWFYDPQRSGGGALIDLGIHMADLLRYAIGDEVREVSAVLRQDGPVEHAAHVVLGFEGGAVGSMAISWEARPGPDHELVIFGTDGTVALNRGRPTLSTADGSERTPLELPEQTDDPCAVFVRAIASGEAPSVTGRDGREALAIVLAGYEAARTRTTVAVRRRP